MSIVQMLTGSDPDALLYRARMLERRNETGALQALIGQYPWLALRWLDGGDTPRRASGEPLWAPVAGGQDIRSIDALSLRGVVIQVAVTPRRLALWACDCAEKSLPIWSDRHPDDTRPSEAIDIAYCVAFGRLPIEEAWAAAREAARAAGEEARAAVDAATDAATAAADAAAEAAAACAAYAGGARPCSEWVAAAAADAAAAAAHRAGIQADEIARALVRQLLNDEEAA